MSEQFIEFLKVLAPKAFENAQVMEQLIFQDPASAMAKSRNFLEEIIASVFEKEGLTEQELQYKILFDRIGFLATEGYLDSEIQMSIHSLRKIGNRGAHESIPDLEQAAKAHKLVYSVAVWFYETYSKEHITIPEYTFPKPKDNMQELKDYIDKMFGNFIDKSQQMKYEVDEVKSKDESEYSNELSIELDLQNGESYLVRELKRLQDSSKEAIESAQVFTPFKDYLHVNRKVQRDLVDILKNKSSSNKSNLILICGSVGDGKSHLLAYLKSKHADLVNNYSIINDATESYSPNMNALETLKLSLMGYSDKQIEESGQKTLLAINMGVLHNFIHDDNQNEFNELKQFIDDSGLFSQQITQQFTSEHFDLICIGDYHPYELTVNGTQSEFYSGLIEKIFDRNPNNLFYQSYQEDIKNNIYTISHFNYEFMQDSQVQNTIIKLIIESIIKYKLVISARSFLNFLVDIIIVDDMNPFNLMDEFVKLENSLPHLLFNRNERSFILKHMNLLNPALLTRSKYIDQLIIDLNTLNDMESVVYKNVQNAKGRELLGVLVKDKDMENAPFLRFAETVILTAYLTNDEFSKSISDNMYEMYIYRLYGYNTSNRDIVRDIYSEVKESMFKWMGSPRRDYIYMSNDSTKFRLAQKLQFKPSMSHIPNNKGIVLDHFNNKFTVSYMTGENNKEIADIEIDYSLFKLIRLIINGYVPNKQDYEDSIKFMEFMDKMMASGSKNKELLVHVQSENKVFLISKDEFYGFMFEKETQV